jgi:hypothetical protein
MPQVPRIRRAEPRTQPVQARESIAVKVTMIWHDGRKQEYDGAPVAWTQDAVEIEWTTPWGDRRRDGVSAYQVRRNSWQHSRSVV